MKPKSTLRPFLAALGASVMAVSSASAEGTSATWDTNADGNWTDPLNWTGDTDYAWGADYTATFGNFITANRVITLNANIIIGNITASDTSHNYTISGANTLTLDRTTGIPEIDVTTAGRTLTISSQISGSDGLKKIGAGILVLSSAANNYTGGTTINAGTLSIGADANLGNAANTITLNGGGLLFTTDNMTTSRGVTLNAATGNQIALGNGVDVTLNGAFTGDGGVNFTKSGAGNSSTSATLTSTSNDFKGALGIWSNNSGVTVKMRSLADSETANGNIIFGNGGQGQTFDWDSAGGATNHLTLNYRGIEFAGDGNTSGTINKTSSTQNLIINTGITATGTGNKTLNVNVGGTNDQINGDISDGTGVLSLNKTNGGTLVLSGNNSYTGATSIGNGTLSVNTLADFGQNSAIGKGTNGVAITIGGTTSSGTLLYTGGTTSTNRTIKISGFDQANGGGATITNNGTGKLTFTAATSSTPFNESYTANTATTRPLTLRGTNDGEIQGKIQDGGSNLNPVDNLPFLKTSLTKSDAGTWTLSGDNTYSGATTVNGGTLIINGNSSTALGAVNVTNAGTTLGGTGTVGGNTTLNTGTILSPGNSPGTLTFANNLILNNGATYLFEAGDLAAVTGILDLNTNWTLSLGSGFQDGGSVILFTYGTLAADPALTPNFFLDNLGFTPSGPLTVTADAGFVTLNGISVIPEPRAALLGGIGLLMLLRRRRS